MNNILDNKVVYAYRWKDLEPSKSFFKWENNTSVVHACNPVNQEAEAEE